MAFTEQLTQALSIPVASLYPASVTFDNTNATTVPAANTDGVDMSRFRRIMAHIKLGVGAPNNGTAKIYAYFLGSNTNNGTYSAFSTNTNTTLNTNNTEATLEVRADQLPTGNRYVKLAILVPVANAIMSATIYGGEAAYKPAQQYDFATNQTTGVTNTTLLNRVVT